MATIENKTQLEKLLKTVSKPWSRGNRKICAPDLLDKDLEFLRAISVPIFDVSGISNKDLQKKLQISLRLKICPIKNYRAR